MKVSWREVGIDVLTDVVAGALIAAGVYNFALQADFPVAGFSGIAIILYHLLGVPAGIGTILLNIPKRYVGLYFFHRHRNEILSARGRPPHEYQSKSRTTQYAHAERGKKPASFIYRKKRSYIIYNNGANEQMYQIKKMVHSLDPEAFTIIVESNEVVGEGFKEEVTNYK